MPITGADFTNAQSSASGIDSISTAKSLSEENSNISMSDFFTLLSAQMQNQTMYDSVDTSEYMSQLVQYTMLAQMKELSASAATSYAVSLVGKNVDVSGLDESGNEILVSGAVDEVAFQDGTPYICVNGSYYQTSDILSVQGGA
jgi:Flagellar hook capping protein